MENFILISTNKVVMHIHNFTHDPFNALIPYYREAVMETNTTCNALSKCHDFIDECHLLNNNLKNGIMDWLPCMLVAHFTLSILQ